MKTVDFSTTFIWIIIISLVVNFFVSVETSHCSTGAYTLSSAGICTGETLTSATMWSATHSPLIAETRFLFLILVISTLLPNLKRLFIRRVPQPGITRHASLLIRSGPIPRRVFIPYLFATHDW